MKIFKTKSWLNSKSFWGSLLFAIALWGYTSLNADYQTIVEIPFHVKLPSTRALEATPPRSVYVDVKGTGWNLFNLIFFNESKTCFVDLSKETILDSSYRINKIDIQKSIKYLKNVNPVNILPETISLTTGQIDEYEIFVVPKVIVVPRNGFTVVGRVRVEPEKIRIRGNQKIVGQISRWDTEQKWFENMNSPFEAMVQLIDTLPGVVDVFPKTVRIKVDIQQIGDIIIPDIPISIVNGSLPDGHFIQPPIITLTLQGGVEEIAKLSKADISALIEFERLLNDSTGILKPIIKLPPNITLLRTDPQYIYHIIKEKPKF